MLLHLIVYYIDLTIENIMSTLRNTPFRFSDGSGRIKIQEERQTSKNNTSERSTVDNDNSTASQCPLNFCSSNFPLYFHPVKQLNEIPTLGCMPKYQEQNWTAVNYNIYHCFGLLFIKFLKIDLEDSWCLLCIAPCEVVAVDMPDGSPLGYSDDRFGSVVLFHNPFL